MDRVTVAALQQMKRERRKIVGVVVYDVQMARIADRAGVDIVSVGDAVTAAQVLVKDGGADLVKVEAGPGTIRTIVDAGIPVWAQLSGQWAVGSGQEIAGSGQQAAGSGQSVVGSGQISGQSA